MGTLLKVGFGFLLGAVTVFAVESTMGYDKVEELETIEE